MQKNTTRFSSTFFNRSLLVSVVALAPLAACTTDLTPEEALELEIDAPSPTESKIVGGTSTTIASHPWQISLRTSGGSHFCGGSIVSANYIVTAQHCLEGASASSLRVVAGITKRSQSATGQIRTVAQIIRYPGYSSPENGEDIALLRLSTALDLSSSNVSAIPITTSADVDAGRTAANVIATVTGWGTTSSGGSSPDTLQAVNVPIVSNATAQSAYSQETITTDQLAAGSAGKDSCQGDSGGPLTVAGANGPILAGVVSWGYGCGSAVYPGLYARVSSFASWLVQNSDIATQTPPPEEPPPTEEPPPASGDDVVYTQAGLSGATGSFQHFSVTVPAGSSALEAVLAGGSGDADLYVRQGAQPTTSTYVCRPYLEGNNESCSIANPQAGTWYVSVQAYTAFSGASITVTVRGTEGSSTVGTPVTLASDDFSSGSWSGGSGFTGAWVRSGDTALSEGGARLRRSTGDIRRTVDVSGVTGLKLSLQAAVAGFESNDTALIRVSSNGGASYTTVKTFTNADSNSTWTPHVIDLSAFDGASSLIVRFDAQMNATSDYLYVDDITVSGIQ